MISKNEKKYQIKNMFLNLKIVPVKKVHNFENNHEFRKLCVIFKKLMNLKNHCVFGKTSQIQKSTSLEKVDRFKKRKNIKKMKRSENQKKKKVHGRF